MDFLSFMEEVCSEKNKSITDEIFLLIQNDRELMSKYLRLVEQDGLDKINQDIGREVKKRYGLSNAESRQENPRSTLIKSHQEFQ